MPITRANNVSKEYKGARFVTKDAPTAKRTVPTLPSQASAKAVAATSKPRASKRRNVSTLQKKGLFSGGMGPLRRSTKAKAKPRFGVTKLRRW